MFAMLTACSVPSTRVAGCYSRQSTTRSLRTCAPKQRSTVFRTAAVGYSRSDPAKSFRRSNPFRNGLASRPQSNKGSDYRSQILTRAGWNDFEWSKVSVVSNEVAAKGLYSVVLDVGAELASGYTKPGQFMQMRVDEDGKPAFIAISSPPSKDAPTHLEFLIKTVPGATAESICSLPTGGAVEVSPVMGKGFDISRLPEGVKTILVFATGSGISPIRALIEAGAESGGLAGSAAGDLRLYYGAQDKDTMAFADKFAAWEEAGVRVVPVFSKAEAKQYVQDAFQGDVEPLEAAGADSIGAVLCGQKEMAEAITEALTGMGVSKDNILMNF